MSACLNATDVFAMIGAGVRPTFRVCRVRFRNADGEFVEDAAEKLKTR